MESSNDEVESAENELLKSYVNSFLSTTIHVDRLATWLVVGLGATASAMITNINEIAKTIPEIKIKYAILILCVSITFGIFQKFFCFLIQLDLDHEEMLRQKLTDLKSRGHLEKLKQVDGVVLKTIARYRDLHPNVFTKYFSNINKKQAEMLRQRIRWYYYQYALSIILLFGFVSFLLVIAF
jgi:hypothetical protein